METLREQVLEIISRPEPDWTSHLIFEGDDEKLYDIRNRLDKLEEIVLVLADNIDKQLSNQ